MANPVLQAAFIRDHPAHFLEICAYTFRSSIETYARQIVGVLGWLQIRLPLWLYAGMWIALALSTGFQGLTKSQKVADAARVFFGFLALLMLLGIYVALYEMWNAVGAPVIEGVQGRYFILMLPLLAMAGFHSLWPRLGVAAGVRKSLYAFAIVANGCALFFNFAPRSCVRERARRTALRPRN